MVLTLTFQDNGDTDDFRRDFNRNGLLSNNNANNNTTKDWKIRTTIIIIIVRRMVELKSNKIKEVEKFNKRIKSSALATALTK